MLGRISNTIENIIYIRNMPTITAAIIPSILQHVAISPQHADSLFEFSTKRKVPSYGDISSMLHRRRRIRFFKILAEAYIRKCSQFGDFARLTRGLAVMAIEGQPIDMDWFFVVCSASDDTRGLMQEWNNWCAKGFKPKESTYMTIVQHLARKGHHAAALRVCGDLERCAHEHPAQAFNARMLVYGAHGDVAACKIALADMAARGIAQDGVSYLRLVEAYVRASDLVSARSVLVEMRAGGYVVDSTAHSILLSAYAQKGDLRACDQLAQEMHKNGMRATLQAYTYWIDGLCENRKVWDAMCVVDEMKKLEMRIPLATWAKLLEVTWKGEEKKEKREVFDRLWNSGTPPTLVFLVLMEMEEKKDNWESVFELAHDLRRRGGYWDYTVMEKVIKALERRGHTTEWLETIEYAARRFDVPVSSHLFLSVVQQQDIKPDSVVFKLMMASIRRGEKVDKRVYEVLVEKWIGASNINEALWVVREMKRVGEIVGTELVERWVKYMQNRRWWQVCVQFLRGLQQSGIELNEKTKGAIIEGYAVLKDIKEAEKVWTGGGRGEMSNSMMLAYTNCGETQKAYQLLQYIKTEGIIVNESGYTAIVTMLGNKGEIEEIEKTYKEVLEKHVVHGEGLQNAILSAFVKQKREKSLVELLKKHSDRLEAQCFLGVLQSLNILR